MSMVTYSDLLAPSPTSPSSSVADRSLQMMQAMQMPPGGGLSASDLTIFANWVQQGTPMGSCGSDGGVAPNPYDTPVVCTSGTTWTGGNRESPLMHPGDACIACHSSGEGPRFSIAGTLFPSAHEPSDCNGSSSAASIVITDALGATHTLSPNAAGNFYLQSGIATPYYAKVIYQGRTRAMAEAQTSGDCNSCHTEQGANGAPGRVMLP